VRRGVNLPLTPKTAKMQATSINIQPVKNDSEAHNLRTKKLDYVKTELSSKNESWSCDKIETRLTKIKDDYFKNTGQQMQKKATPIREGVVVITEKTTMKDLQAFAAKIEESFGIKTIQIHLHQDEGHTKTGDMNNDWKPNLHAHMVFDWTEGNTGRTCKLHKHHMSEMQTILAETLGMERGKSSDTKHLNAIQFKNQAEEERKEQLQKEVSRIETIKTLKTGVIKGVERFSDMMGLSANDKAKMALERENLGLKEEVGKLKDQLGEVKYDYSDLKKQLKSKERAINHYRENGEKLENYTKQVKIELQNFGKILDLRNEKTINKLKGEFPMLYKELEKGVNPNKGKNLDNQKL